MDLRRLASLGSVRVGDQVVSRWKSTPQEWDDANVAVGWHAAMAGISLEDVSAGDLIESES